MSDKRDMTRRDGTRFAGPAAFKRLLPLLLIVSFILGGISHPAFAGYMPGMPPNIDPGTPAYSASSSPNPVPAEPVAYDPATSMLQAAYDADMAGGGSSFWFDRVLERPFLNNNDSYLYTRGRALYMYTHAPGALGFAGGYAYRERPTGSNQNLYTIAISGATLAETTAQRRQYPSHWSSVHTAAGLSVAQKKFITNNNVAVTILTITAISATTRMLTVSSPIATVPSSDGTELTGPTSIRYGLTTIYPRLSGDGFTVNGTNLTRSITLDAGQSISLKIVMGVIANELPESAADYQRFRGYDPNTALVTQIREYNQWWADNVPYIDLPDQNVKKMSYYRTFLNRYNFFDGNIPGNDYQFPVSIEGVLGYNNAIQLTQPMHMQDLKYFRDPLYSYGIWLSSGETSKYSAFTDNPGNTANWNNTYEQYIAREAWNSYKIHGGQPAILNNLARYAEGDVKGQLAKYDGNNNALIAYDQGALTGNDADAVALAYFSPTRAQDRTESAFWYSGAKAAAEMYDLLGNSAKAAEMNTLAQNIKNAVLTLLWDDSPAADGGKVFKQKDVQTGALIPWKDQQNFSPFTEGIVPNTDNYKQALRYYADRAEFPIMPFYTANQRDKAAAAAAGRAGSNNFSNINATLQAQLYSAAIREYPSAYVTPDMYRKLIEWLSWTQYINRDNRFPDNNEFWFNYNQAAGTLGRSGIHHNILGAYNFILIEDMAGIRPRLDEVVELWPIDMGYAYFTVNNLSYHGHDLTIVWDRPDGVQHYANAPEGYSLYIDGVRAFTVDDLAHVSWEAATGTVTILDGSDTNVVFNSSTALDQATEVSLWGNPRVVDMFQKTGVDLTAETGATVNLARGKPVSASYTTTSPSLQATAAENAVDGFTVSGLPVQAGAYIARNPIWGNLGSPNAQDWFEVNFGAPTEFDSVKLYFYSNKNFGVGGNTYRQPGHYTIQYFDGTDWVRVPQQRKSRLQANYNSVRFDPITATRMRVLMTPTPGYAIGLKEIQVFDTGIPLPPVVNQPPLVEAHQDTSFKFPLKAALIGSVTDDELVLEFPGVTWSKKSGPGQVSFANPHAAGTLATFSTAGTYVLTLSADDGEFTTSADVTVAVTPLPADINLAPLATPSTSYVSPWENLFAINDGYEPSSSTDKGPGAYGNWNVAGATQWVQYTWPEEVVVDKSAVYWWTDNGGILMPTASRLDYWDGSAFVPMPDAVGNGVAPNTYNTTTFSPVKTDRVRLTITRGTQWTGILEWKVFQAPVQSIQPVAVTTVEGTLPELPPTVTAVFTNDVTLDKKVIWAPVSPEQVAQGGTQFEVTGAVDISHVAATATVTVTAVPPSVSNNLASQTVQYTDASQPVIITATDKAADIPLLAASTAWSVDGGAFQSGLPAGLTLTAGSCTDDGAHGACTWTLGGRSLVQSGTYVVRTTVSDGVASSYTDVTIVVTPEDAYLQYTGDAIARIGTNLTLRATVWDSAASGYLGAHPETGASATLGDLGKIWVAFDLYPAGKCLSGTPTTQYAQVSDSEPAGDGIGTASTTFTSTSEARLCVVARVVAGSSGGANPWYTADRAEAAALTFYKNTSQFVTGSGWVYDPSGSKGIFELNARYNQQGQPQGNMVYTYRGVYNGSLADFVITSTAFNALAFGGTKFPIPATVQGICTIQVIRSSDAALLYSESNASFQATASDSGTNARNGTDSIALTVYTRNGLPFKRVPTILLQGGNVVVH